MASQRTSSLYSDPDRCSSRPNDAPADGDCNESRPLLSHVLYPSTASEDTLVDVEAADLSTTKNGGGGGGGTTGITPLPLAQLGSVCVCRIVDPIMFTQIFPYVNEMMRDLKVTDDPSRIGFYSGLVESAFAVAQVLSIFPWARLSDTIGRRPVIFTGILGMAVFSATFGLSTTLTGVLLSRSLSGFFSGNVAVVHSVLGELTDASNQAVAFPIYSLTWPIGAIIGPLIGGTFAHPADRFPAVFASTAAFWRTYPYFLPGFLAAVIALGGFLFGYLALEETLPSKRRKRERAPALTLTSDGNDSDAASDQWDDDKVAPPPPGMRELLRIPAIRALCASGSAQSFVCTAFDVLFVLMCYSPVESGGLAFSTSEIGAALAMSGVVAMLIQLFVTPVLLARCDLARLYRTTMGLWTYCFALLPLIGVFVRLALADIDVDATDEPLSLAQASPAARALVWCAIAALLALAKVACLPFAISMILVKVHAPGAEALGASNGLVQFAMSFTRAFSPAVASAVFALSIQHRRLCGGYLWALIMVAFSLAGTRVCAGLDAQSGGRPIRGADLAAVVVAE